MRDFEVNTIGARTHFVPTRTSVRRTFAMLGLGALLMLVGGFVMFYTHPDVNGRPLKIYPIGGIVTAILFAMVGFWMWRIRSTPLIVDATSREVCFGEKVICESGTVKSVRLACSHLKATENDCSFNFVMASGEWREIPSPWLSTMSASSTREMANSIAALLAVNVQTKEP